MRIPIEYNSDLTLNPYKTSEREPAECLPEKFEIGSRYEFLKKGQIIFPLNKSIPLFEIRENSRLSDILAGVKIIETTHSIRRGEIWTKGLYEINFLRKDNLSKPYTNLY